MTHELSDRDELRRRRRRFGRSVAWRWVRRIALVLVLNLLIFAGCRYQEWSSTRQAGVARRDALVAQLDATEPGWRAHDLTAGRNATLPPPERNAAAVAVNGVRLKPSSFDEWTKLAKWRTELKPPTLPEPRDITEAKTVRAECEPALAVCRSARAIPGGGFPRTYQEPNPMLTRMQDVQDLREAAVLLDLDALVAAHDGRGDAALESALAAVAVGRGIGDDPSVIAQLVRMAAMATAVRSAERTISWCEGGDRALADLQGAVAAEADAPRMLYALRGERAMWHLMMANMDSGALWMQDVANDKSGHRPSLEDRFGHWALQMHMPEQQAKSLELFGDLLALARTPHTPKRDAEFDAIAGRVQSLPALESMVLRLLMPAFNKIAAADTRTTALCRTTTVALACERFRLKSGRFPESLAELPKELLNEVPADPYTGNGLLYRLTDTGAVVYCTGPDQTDDGGELDPVPKPGFDVGFRLFDPEHRRQPPELEPTTDQRE